MNKLLEKVKAGLKKAKFDNVDLYEWRSSIVLTGRVNSWDEKIQAGYIAANKGYKGVVNDIKVVGAKTDEMAKPDIYDNSLEGEQFDVVIIGGGITGCSIARELSRYNITIALIEKEEDLAKHASGRNDGMIHPGIADKPSSKKAHYNIRGNRAYGKICEELGVDFQRPGSFILFNSPISELLLPILMVRAEQNGVDGYKFFTRRKVKEMIPYVTEKQFGGFFLPSAGVLSPYKLTVAMAENAVQNGVKILLNTVLLGFEMEKGHIAKIKTNRGNITAGVVVNAAGIWADTVADYATDRFFSLHGRKGVDAILDKKTGKYQPAIMAMPDLLSFKGSHTKGGGLITTPEGNLLIGPTANEVPTREDYSTEPNDIDELMKHLELNTKLKRTDIITYFAGIRACTYEEDFIIEPSSYVDNLVHAAGIQSPGLASAPAIAHDISKMVCTILKKTKEVKNKENFNPKRITFPELNKLSLEDRAKIIKENPFYGRIVCRCEQISEGEIKNTLHSPIPVLSLDGLKRRFRIGAGRCQGGFCTPRVMEIMSEELNIKLTDIKKKGAGSEILFNETKENVSYSDKKLKTMLE
ncbi:MAG: FAD-dependent oxidoreductase [Desulfobacterales bacterium]|nr:FAD-dependent oxidoreductase [Desulfobacterales bacterium]